MRTINSLLQAAEKINMTQILEQSVDYTKDDLLRRNKEQLFDGKLSTGQDLSPTYLEDPYFKSAEAAKKYSDWKDRITPNPNRKSGVPNLFINGAFYDSLSIQVSGESIVTDSSFGGASSIESKFSTKIFGLGGEYKSEYLEETIGPVLNKTVVDQMNKR